MLENLTGKARVWLRERKERAEEKRAAKAHDPHMHSRFWLLNVPALATVCAAITEWYWAILFCIEATGHVDWNYETSAASTGTADALWNFAFSTHWPVFLGLVAATVPIVMLSMVWLPIQFAMRGAGVWRRGSIIAVGVLANILVVISGTVVMNYNRQEQVREALVVEQTAVANRGAIQAQIDAVNEDLARLTDRRINNEYAATAANVGAAAYRAQYMSEEALARSPEARRDIIVRALGAAERADALRAERTGLFQQMAQAPTEAAVAANVTDTVGRELNTFAQYVEVWRPPFVAFICTLIGIFGAWWTLAMLERLNPRDVIRSGWADEAHRIEDKTDEAPIAQEPIVPTRQRRKVYNPETGREEVFVQPKGYWRATGKKQRNADGTEGELTEFVPEIPESEVGVASDGGGRMASVAENPVETEDEPKNDDAGRDLGDARDDAQPEQQIIQDQPSETLPDLPEELTGSEQADEQNDSEAEAEPEAAHIEADEQPHHQPRTEPETDETRLIAAE